MTRSFENQMDSDIMLSFKDSVGDAVTYRRKNGEVITTNATIDVNAEQFGNFESGSVEYRTVITLQKDDIGEPCRGDVIVDGDGDNYVVQDIEEGGSDRSIVQVTVK